MAKKRPPAALSPRLAHAFALLAIGAWSLGLYARTSAYELSYFDDDVLAVEQTGDAAPHAGLWGALTHGYFHTAPSDHAYYRPLVSLSFALDAASGADPGRAHTTNALLHTLATCLLFVLLRVRAPLSAALVVALAFAAHPALTGAVAWIPGRVDILVTVFVLFAWCFARAGERSRVARLGHGLAWFLALACKESALALPLVLGLEAVVLEQRSFREAFAPARLLTWGSALGAHLALRFAVLGPGLGLGAALASATLRGLGDGLRSLVAGIGSLAWPFPPSLLAVPEDMPLARGLSALAVWALAFASFRDARRTLGFALAACVCFSLPGLPAASLLLLDSRLYLPLVPLALGSCQLLARKPESEVTLGACAFVVASLSVAAWRHTPSFRDRTTFAVAAVSSSPHSSLAHRNLGLAAQLGGDSERARREYRTALALDPNEPTLHNNLAVMLMAEGRLTEAREELAAELELHPGSPAARNNLTLVERALGAASERPNRP